MAMDTTLTYHIISRRTGKGMYTDGGSQSENAAVFELPSGVSAADNWKLEKTGTEENYYHIINVHSGFAMGISEYDDIIVQRKSDDSSDDWCFEETEKGFVRILSVDRFNAVMMVRTEGGDGVHELVLYYEDM